MTGAASREAAVRAAFREQEGWSTAMGSPFMARLCAAFAEGLDGSTALGARLLDWPGEPGTLHDAVSLRIAGGLHALVRRGRLPDLARLYPPNPLPEVDALWSAVRAALVEAEADLAPWLDHAPQTNEVARSALLIAGFHAAAVATGMPLALLELGSSAGLNLVADRYRYRLGGAAFGPPDSRLLLAPPWSGPDPRLGDLAIASRRGVDLNPLDVTRAEDRERLPAYVWADQTERLARVEAALALAAADPPPIDRGDAAAWLEARLAESPVPGVCRVVFHSIAFQYFPAETQARIRAALDRHGEAATPETPLAWLRLEPDPDLPRGAGLRLRLWPGGEDRLLAVSDGHVRSVEWRG